MALSDMMAKLTNDYNVAMMGASTSVYAGRIGGFAGAVKEYQDALMAYRATLKSSATTQMLAKQKAQAAFQKMQMKFRHELNAVTLQHKSRRGTPLSSVERGINISRSSRNVAKLNVSNGIQAHNLVKFTNHAKFLGNGLAVIDFASRIGNVHISYKSDDNWERDLFIESSSFAASAVAGTFAVKAGLGLLLMATPAGWLGLIVGGALVAGVAATTSIGLNNYTKENSGEWYDMFMQQINQ